MRTYATLRAFTWFGGSKAKHDTSNARSPRRKSLTSRNDKSVSKVLSMHAAIAEFVPDGASVAMGLQLEQMIPFAAGHEIIRQKKRGLTLIGPISDILFD